MWKYEYLFINYIALLGFNNTTFNINLMICMSISVINFLIIHNLFNTTTFSHLLFFVSILSIILEFVIPQHFKTKSVFLFFWKKRKGSYLVDWFERTRLRHWTIWGSFTPFSTWRWKQSFWNAVVQRTQNARHPPNISQTYWILN